MILNAKTRQREEKLESDSMPAVVYGSGSDNQMLTLNAVEFEKLFNQFGEASLVDLKIDDKEPVKTLIKEVQKDSVKGNIIHADLYRVDMTKKINTEVPLHFIGQSKAEKEMGAMINKNIDAVEVECLPQDLIQSIEVDISSLQNFGDSIHLKDLKLPASVELTGEPEEVIVSAVEPRIEAEPESTDKEVEDAESDNKVEETKEGASEEEKKED